MSSEERQHYFKEAEDLKKKDKEKHPPYGYKGNFRMITIPREFLNAATLEKRTRKLVSNSWYWLMKALKFRLCRHNISN